jgi:hypothetical protein
MKPGMVARATLDVSVDRHPLRGVCEACSRRRVLYRLLVSLGETWPPVGVTPWRCLPCWGLR